MEENTKLNMQMYDPESVLVPLQKLNLMDDFLFDAATVDLETCKIIIELSLGITIRNIVWKEGQKVIHNLPGSRGIRLDFYVEDDQGQVFDGLKPAYIVVICGFDLFGYGLYRYTFDNRCKEVPDLVMGDECQKIILNTKGKNDHEVEKALVDFLHYVEKSSDENVPEDCDERLKRLHKKIHQIKMSEEIGVSYMKMEERDRLIRDEGLRRGRAEGRAEGKAELISIIRKKASRGMAAADIADWLETECGEVKRILELMRTYPDWTDLQVAEELVRRENVYEDQV